MVLDLLSWWSGPWFWHHILLALFVVSLGCDVFQSLLRHPDRQSNAVATQKSVVSGCFSFLHQVLHESKTGAPVNIECNSCFCNLGSCWAHLWSWAHSQMVTFNMLSGVSSGPPHTAYVFLFLGTSDLSSFETPNTILRVFFPNRPCRPCAWATSKSGSPSLAQGTERRLSRRQELRYARILVLALDAWEMARRRSVG